MKKKIAQNKYHKIEPACFNKCIEWKLTISYSHMKTNYSSTFMGKSLFFKKLEQSLLDNLQSLLIKQEKTPPKTHLQNFADMSNGQLASQANPERDNDILNIKFPINNAEFNYMIIDSNHAIKENLNNIFFLEFDLTSNKESQKLLREINNDSVEREFFFLLNGYMHGTKLFTSDVKFSVETKKFIKSIQFKLENYKNELIQKKKMAKGQAQSIRNYFFSKVHVNTNLGIEFYKPYFDPQQPDNFLTNFNSVVNSNITLNKIILELGIPKIFINNGLTLTTSVSDNANDQTANNLKIEKFQSNALSLKTGHKAKPVTISSETKIPPLYDSDFKSLKDNKFNSPFESFARTTKNIYANNQYFSPDYLQMNHPTIYGNNPNLSGINTTSTSSVYFSPNYTQYMQLSPNSIPFQNQHPNMQSRINPQIKPIEFDNSYNMQPRRLSENTRDNMMENTLSSYCNSSVNSARSHINQTMNIIRSPPMNTRFNPDLGFPYKQYPPLIRNFHSNNDDNHYSGLANNGFVSPRAVSNFKFGLECGIGNNIIGNNQEVVPTIKKKIIDWEKLNNVQEEKKVKLTLEEQKYQIFLQNYDNLCNFLLFLRGNTPYIIKKNIESFKQMLICNFFKGFVPSSLFGLKISYLTEEMKINDTYYSPTLSSMEMTITDQESLLSIIDTLIQLKQCSPIIKSYITQEEIPNPKTNHSYLEYTPIEKLPCLKVILRDLSSITIEYYESKPPHNRPLFSTQITQILSLFKNIAALELNKVDPDSWFSILWTPFKSRDNKFMSTSFITYYQFKYSEESLFKQTVYAEIPIVGILPNKMIHEIFLQRMNNPNYQPGFYQPGVSENLLLKSSIENVTNVVLQNANRRSVDVDYYLKNYGSLIL